MSNEVLLDIVLAPATYLALALISLALLFTYLWHRKNLKFDTFKVLFESQLGFTPLNNAVIKFTQTLAGLLSRSQTGILNWNLFGILLTLALLLLLKGGNL